MGITEKKQFDHWDAVKDRLDTYEAEKAKRAEERRKKDEERAIKEKAE